MKEIIAYIAAVLAVVSIVPYAIDIVRRKTRPNIVSWITWTILTGIATAAAFTAGEPRAALLTLGSTICSLIVVGLGVKYGIAKLSWFDVTCWVLALVGLLLWQIFSSPTVAITMSVGIDFAGALPTLRHAWLKPSEETWQTFMIGTLGPFLTLVSLEQLTFNGVLYAGYLLLANGAIALTVILRRWQQNIPLSRKGIGIHETLHE